MWKVVYLMISFVYSLSSILCFLCILTVPVALIVWIALLITKKQKVKIAKYVFLCNLGAIVLYAIIAIATSSTCDHNWEIVVKEATCVEAGGTTKQCSICGKERQIEKSPSLEHAWNETVKEASCTKDGERLRKCTICGEIVIETIKAQHSYSEHIALEPKCETAGIRQMFCTVCGDIIDEVIPAIGHNWLDAEKSVPKICAVCGVTEFNRKEIVFRDIPWGSSSSDVEQKLENSNDAVYAKIWEKQYIQYPDELLEPYFVDGIVQGGNILIVSNLTAGGYDISMAQLHFAYSVEEDYVDRNTDIFYAAVYYFDVVDHEAVYNDLRKKMTEIYGEGQETMGTKTGWIGSADYTGEYENTVKRVTWYGANKTFVTLQWIYDDNKAEAIQSHCGVTMVYGKTDAKDMLDNLEKALDREKTEIDKENAVNNYEGL